MATMDIYDKESRDKIKEIIAKESKNRLKVNQALMKILHGNMTDPLVSKLKQDMPETYTSAIDRIMPINFLRRIINKITHIYQTGVDRNVTPENQGDQDAMEQYVRDVSLNTELNYNNELYNTFGYSLQSIALDDENEPYTVAVDNDQFIPVNLSRNRKNQLDLLILIMEKDPESGTQIYWIWTDDQFMIMDNKGEVRWDLMIEVYDDPTMSRQEMSENPYGRIPYQYLTKSKTSIMPEVAKDILQIALVIPLLLTDLNYISKYTAFSILWTIDIDSKDLPQAPNATWNLNSKKGGLDGEDRKPQIGTIKPEGDLDQLAKVALQGLAMWLNSIGIKTGSIGSVDGDGLASGVSKLVDEMDVSDLRETQTRDYSGMEHDYFDLYFHYINPVWIDDSDYAGNRHEYNPDSEVITVFPIQRPVLDRKSVIEEQKAELEAGLTTRKRALKKVNPEMSDEEIDTLLAEIQQEMGSNVEETEETEGAA